MTAFLAADQLRVQQAREALVGFVADALIDACGHEDVSDLTDVLDDVMSSLEGPGRCEKAAGYMRASWNRIPWRIANSRGCVGLAGMCAGAAHLCLSVIVEQEPAGEWVALAEILHQRGHMPVWVGVLALMSPASDLGDVNEVLQVCEQL
jgi:hypothetical protein